MFSVKESKRHKIYNIFGIKLKLKKQITREDIKQAKEEAIRKANQYVDKMFTILNANSMSVDDKIRFLSQKFYRNTGYYPNFKYPKSFNEKLNWLRYNYTNFKLRKIVADKLLFKQYIEEKLGPGYTTKLLNVFDDIADLNFEGLPDKFVIKTTLGFGAKAVKIIKDKKTADLDEIKFELSETLNPMQGEFGAGSPKKQKIIVEEYVEQIDGQLNDYKFLCFHGEPKVIIAICDRKSGSYSIAYYDTDWNKLDVKKANYKNKDVEKPKNLENMLEIARKLSADFPFMRVDMYNIDGKILAGEMTFIPAGAMSKFEPIEWDYKIGEWLDLGRINPEHLRILPEFKESAKTFIDSAIVDKCAVE